MKIAVITTGDEVMAGNITDTNARWLSENCWNAGIKTVWRYSVADVSEDIGEACRLASEKADVVLVTGGLGPTSDDITLQAAANAFGKELELHENVLREIDRFFKKIGRPMADSNKKQAYLPQKGEALPNRVGTAPGCQVQLGKALFFFLPGVPKELYPMFSEIVFPRLREKISGSRFFKEVVLRCFGAPEATLDSALQGVPLGKTRLSFRVCFPEILIKLVCWGEGENRVGQSLEQAKKEVLKRIEKYVYGEGERSLAWEVGEKLRRRKETLAVAESCTGGAVASAITDVEGASEYFERGVVTYSNRSKRDFLSVSEATLNKKGAVSEDAAKEMAEGVRRVSDATYGLSITGIAGPSGGTAEKPVGTVFVGLSKAEKTVVRSFFFPRSRLEFKKLVTFTALRLLHQELQ